MTLSSGNRFKMPIFEKAKEKVQWLTLAHLLHKGLFQTKNIRETPGTKWNNQNEMVGAN